MIPTMILFGLVFGRWWKLALVVGGLGWPLLLLATDVIHSPGEFVGAAALGFLNTLVGVAAHQAGLTVLRLVRGRRPARDPAR